MAVLTPPTRRNGPSASNTDAMANAVHQRGGRHPARSATRIIPIATSDTDAAFSFVEFWAPPPAGTVWAVPGDRSAWAPVS